MANNEERFCEHCGCNTIFFLESDLIWYCDDCGKPFGSFPIIKDEEFEETLEEFEEMFGPSVYCETCGNFVCIDEISEFGICPYCADELESALYEKGYTFDEDMGMYRLSEED